MDPPDYTLPADLRDEISHAFAHCDPDRTGSIATDNLGTVMRAIGQNPTESELYRLCEELDKFSTGSIFYGDFLELMTKNYQVFDKDDVIKNAFTIFDRDDDGFVSHAELRAVFNNVGEKLTDDEFDDVFRVVDIDGDGLINWNDFYQAFKS